MFSLRLKFIIGGIAITAVFTALAVFVIRAEQRNLETLEALEAQRKRTELWTELSERVHGFALAGLTVMSGADGRTEEEFDRRLTDLEDMLGRLGDRPSTGEEERLALTRAASAIRQIGDTVREALLDRAVGKEGAEAAAAEELDTDTEGGEGAMEPARRVSSLAETAGSLFGELEKKADQELGTRQQEAREEAASTKSMLLVFFVLFLLASVLYGRMLYRSINSAVEEVETIAGRMAEGDLRPSAEDKAVGDEVFNRITGAVDGMRNGIGDFLRSMRESLTGVNLYTEAASEAVDQVTRGSEKQRTSSRDIAEEARSTQHDVVTMTRTVGELHESTNDNMATILELKASIREIADQTANFASFIDQSAGSIENSMTAHEKITERIEASGARINDTEAAVSELQHVVKEIKESVARSSRSAESVADTIRDEGIGYIEGSIQSMETIKESAEETARAVGEMERLSESMDSVIRIIRGVAENTSLLSLNAAILAAQAGEYGRGFGVISDQIQQMAENTSQNARGIASTILELKETMKQLSEGQRKTRSLIEEGSTMIASAGELFGRVLDTSRESAEVASFVERSTEEQLRSVSEIGRSVEEINSWMQEIVETSQEQTSAGRQILEGIGQMKEFAHSLKRATADQSQGADIIARTTEETFTDVENVRISMDEMARRTERTVSWIEEIARVAEDNLEHSRTLGQGVEGLAMAVENLGMALEKFKV